jgi:hypothetical protein
MKAQTTIQVRIVESEYYKFAPEGSLKHRCPMCNSPIQIKIKNETGLDNISIGLSIIDRVNGKFKSQTDVTPMFFEGCDDAV